MTADKPAENTSARDKGKEATGRGEARPDWANGLRRLYDSVVEEDLPDSFKDLLAQLDAKD